MCRFYYTSFPPEVRRAVEKAAEVPVYECKPVTKSSPEIFPSWCGRLCFYWLHKGTSQCPTVKVQTSQTLTTACASTPCSGCTLLGAAGNHYYAEQAIHMNGFHGRTLRMDWLCFKGTKFRLSKTNRLKVMTIRKCWWDRDVSRGTSSESHGSCFI